MAGENPEEARTGSDDEFLSKTKWQRFRVMIMGPAMNILLAIVVLWAVLFQGAEVPSYEQQPPIVGAVTPGSAAETAGIRPGDRILRVGDTNTETWEKFFMAVLPRAKREVPVVVERDGRRLTIPVVPSASSKFETGEVGLLPKMQPQIRAVEPGRPADKAGIKRGDVVLAVNGQPPSHENPFVKTINSNAGKPLQLSIRRGTDQVELTVTPELRDGRGLIGVQLSDFEVRTVQPGLVAALKMSLNQNWEWSGLIFKTLIGLFTHETSPRQLMGPVGIAQLSGASAQLGWIPLFSLMAMISLNLGILNLLPIPVLDGGHIMIMALEGLARRDFSMRIKEKVLLAGFVVLLMLMVTVIYNDLTRIPWIESLMPWR
jgi:regulator of sigma E protease